MLAWCGQQLIHLINDAVGALVHGFRPQATERVLNNGDGQSGKAQRGRLGSTQRDKFCRTNRRRGNAALFQLNGIVDTPRCTRASIPDGVDHHITLGQIIDHIWRGGRAGIFVAIDHLGEMKTIL